MVTCRWGVCSPSAAFMALLFLSEKYSWNHIQAALALLLTQGLDFQWLRQNQRSLRWGNPPSRLPGRL